MTKKQQEILEQDRKDTQEYIDSLSQEELDNIPVEEDLISDEELQEMQDSLDILLEQYTSNLEEIEKYKDILRKNVNDTLEDKDSMERCISLGVIQTLLKQLNKENKTLLEEIKSLEFDIAMNNREVSLDMDLDKTIITEEQAKVLYKYDNNYQLGKNVFEFKNIKTLENLFEIKYNLPKDMTVVFMINLDDYKDNSYPEQQMNDIIKHISVYFDIEYEYDLTDTNKLIIANNNINEQAIKAAREVSETYK
jgi:hypothetical protein